MPLDNWLAHRAAACPNRLAVRDAERDLTYSELEARARAIAVRAGKAGVGAGTVVGIGLRPGGEYAATLHALIKLGAIALPLGPGVAAGERDALLARTGAELVIADPAELGAERGEVPATAEPEPQTALAVVATSGSTGAPRPVSLTYGNFLWSAVGSAFGLGVRSDDRWLCCLPLHHVAGLSILTRSAIWGTGAVVHEGFDLERVAASLADDGVTLVSLVATQLARLLEAGVDLSGPRALVLGGGPVPGELIAEAAGRGATVVETYGMTETCSQVTLLAPHEAPGHAGSAGRATLGARLRIDGGEILVRGPVVAPGMEGEDGWLRTADRGRIDDDGFLYVEGRTDDVIVTGGENVQPAEVEAVLERHPGVAEAAVVGRLDPEWQQAVTAIVVPARSTPPDAEALREHCAAALAPHKVPKSFELAAALPRTPSGKLRRHELR